MSKKLNTDMLKVKETPMKNPLKVEPKAEIGTKATGKSVVKKILGE